MDAQSVQRAQVQFQVELGKYKADDPKAAENLDAALKTLNKVLEDFVKGPGVSDEAQGGGTDGHQQNGGAGAQPGGAPSANNGQPPTPTPAPGSGDNAGKPATDVGPLSGQAQNAPNTAAESSAIAAQYIANLQKDFGLTKEQARGIVANLWHESNGMNSGVNQGNTYGGPSGNNADDNANGFGIAQWGGVRKEGLIKYAKENGLDPSSQAANYRYLKQELSGEFSSVISAVKNTTTSEEALSVFCKQFEKPSDPQMQARSQILSSFS
jgi:Phage tail lysozyme